MFTLQTNANIEAAPDDDSLPEPYLYFTQHDDSRGVTVEANRDIDRLSLQHALQHSLIRREEAAVGEPISAHVVWYSARHAEILISGLDAGESVRFSFNGTKTVQGDAFLAGEQPARNDIVLFGTSEHDELLWLDQKDAREKRAVPIEGNIFQQVGLDQASNLIAYPKSGAPVLVSADTGRVTKLQLPNWWPGAKQPPFGNDYGTSLMFADRFTKDATYVVVGNRYVYLLHWRTGQAEKLFESKAAIYAISASPTGSKAAILTDSDSTIGPDADLTVLNSKGQIETAFRKAAIQSHSQGFLFVYPLAWVNDSSVLAVEQDHYRSIRLSDGEGAERAQDQLSAEERKLLEQQFGVVPETAELIRSRTDANLVAIEINQNVFSPEVWIIDGAAGKLRWAGAGMLLGMSGSGEVIVKPSSERGYRFPAVHLLAEQGH